MKQEMMGWEWHQLDRMRIICTSVQRLQTDNHASTSSRNFLQAACSTWRPSNSIKALKAEKNCPRKLQERQRVTELLSNNEKHHQPTIIAGSGHRRRRTGVMGARHPPFPHVRW